MVKVIDISDKIEKKYKFTSISVTSIHIETSPVFDTEGINIYELVICQVKLKNGIVFLQSKCMTNITK